jgi:hypothetical protein
MYSLIQKAVIMKSNTIPYVAIVVIGLALVMPINLGLAESDNNMESAEFESFEKLSARWWQWALSIPTSENPLLDGSIYIAVEAADISSSDDVSSAMIESLKYLTKKGVTVDCDSVKQTNAKANGMDVVDVSWQGKDSDGACEVSLSIVVVTAKKGLLLTYWGSPEGKKKYDKDLQAIAESIKPL